MATITPVGEWRSPHTHRVKWSALTGSSDTALGASEVNLAYKTVSVTGAFGSATVTIQGSNATTESTATDWATLNDINGSALTFTADRMETIAENPMWIRPVASGATGGTSVDVIMISTRA